MDFRTLINKLDSFNTEAKKEPERMTFSDAINHVKDITFTPPTPAQNEYSIANNIAFKGKDLTDPKVRLALYQDELKRSPGRLLGEIAQRIKPTSDAQIELSMFIGELSEKQKGTLSKEEQTLAFEVIKQAIRNMDIERDADQSTYKDSDAPDASEMESTNEAEKRWKQTSMSPQEAIAKYGKENVKVKKGALRNGDDMVEVFVESMNEAGFDRDSVTYDEVLPFVKMTYKTLLTDLQTARKDIETYKAGGDTGEEGGDIDMIMPHLRDLKDMQVKVKKILDNPDMDIETVVDYMMPSDLDTSPREELIGRFKKSFAKDPQLAKRLFKDPEMTEKEPKGDMDDMMGGDAGDDDTMDVKIGPDGSISKADGDAEEKGEKKELELDEFIKGHFDYTTNAFPKGETAVLTSCEKKYGEQSLAPAAMIMKGLVTNQDPEMERIKHLAGLDG